MIVPHPRTSSPRSLARHAAPRKQERRRGLILDLDDTLYPERQFALSGFAAAERWAAAELAIDGLAAAMTRDRKSTRLNSSHS